VISYGIYFLKIIIHRLEVSKPAEVILSSSSRSILQDRRSTHGTRRKPAKI
jgi:hypothetical protein